MTYTFGNERDAFFRSWRFGGHETVQEEFVQGCESRSGDATAYFGGNDSGDEGTEIGDAIDVEIVVIVGRRGGGGGGVGFGGRQRVLLGGLRGRRIQSSLGQEFATEIV